MLSCFYCEKTFNWEAKFNKHLKSEHSLDPELVYIEKILACVEPRCHCGKDGCPRPRWYGWKKGHNKYVSGHNVSVTIHTPESYAKASQRRKEGYRAGKYSVWNKGLTKESSKSVARAAMSISSAMQRLYESGHVPWQTGKTALNNEHIKKMSETKLRKFASGELRSWNDGLTKFNDQRVAAMGQTLSRHIQEDPSITRKLTTEQLVARIAPFLDRFELVSDISAYKSKYTKLHFKCRTCSSISEKNLMMLEHTPVCYACHPKESMGQLELFDFVKMIDPETKLSDREAIAPKELDIYNANKKLAIEFNGLYFHSELLIPDIGYHANKTKLCESKGIRLLHVFSDEWRDKRPIIESMIRCRMGAISNVVHARKCEIRPLIPSVRREFFGSNHLDGDVKSTVAFGLFSGEDLVAALSLRRPFHKKHAGYLEIGRFASKLNSIVVGGLGKLSKHALGYAKSAGSMGLLSYVDTRHGDGHAYAAAGFKQTGVTDTRFWWTDFSQRYDRFRFRADRSRKLSENDVASRAGVFRIYGCANRIFVLAG